MPIVGYVDDEKNEVRFEDVAKGRGKFAAPLPVLMSMLKGDNDPHDYAELTVSRIAGGLVRQSELLRRHDVFVGWRGSSFAWLGRAVHDVAAAEGRALYSDRFVTERDFIWQHPAGVKIGGRPDSIVKHPARLDFDDYKVTGSYTSRVVKSKGVSHDKPGWIQQLNLYRWLAEYADDSPWRGLGLTAKSKLRIIAVYRDWRKADTCPPIEAFAIPLATDDAVRGWIDAAVTDYLRFRDVPDNALPPCSVGELWFNGREGIARRCADYCAVSGLCNQWAAVLKAVKASAIGRVTLDMLEEAAGAIAAAAQTKRA